MLGIAIITGSGIMRGVEADKIDAKAAYMIDAGTGQVLYQQNADSKYPIASLTKILTLAVIMKDIHNQKFKFSKLYISWYQKNLTYYWRKWLLQNVYSKGNPVKN